MLGTESDKYNNLMHIHQNRLIKEEALKTASLNCRGRIQAVGALRQDPAVLH